MVAAHRRRRWLLMDSLPHRPDAFGDGPLRRAVASVTLYLMSLDVGSDRAARAIFRLGPMDGKEHPIESDTAELSVVMSDGQQHRYARTDDIQRLPDGLLGVVFDWAGRYFGPK